MIPNTIGGSDAGTSVAQGVFGFVKRNLSAAQRRESAASGVRGAGKGAAALVPASAHSDPAREERSELKSNFRVPDYPETYRSQPASSLIRRSFPERRVLRVSW